MEDINGRQGSEAPSSSSSDFYNTGPPAQPVDAPTMPDPSAGEGRTNGHVSEDANGLDDGDSSSEMDVSASSRSASPEAQPDGIQHAGAKRKFSDASDTLGALELALEDPSKKRKVSTPPEATNVHRSCPAQRLPAELWQQVFLRLSPAMLSRCLRVNKEFNTYLTRMKAQPVAKKDQKKVRILDSDAIWAEARKLYFSNMPRPLARCSELEMLQLIGCKTCQFCSRQPVPAPATSPFNAGPGPDGLRVVWPFGIRTCGRCWEQYTIKDVEILVSPAASLRFGLPYAFRTPDLHFVPEMTRQAPGGIPSHLRVAKVYYNQDVQAIQEQYEDAKGFGDGAADEWRKGLATKGREAMADAARWEKWESMMRLGADLAHVLREYDLPSFPRYVEEVQRRSAGYNGAQPVMMTNGPPPPPQPFHSYQNGYGAPYQAHAPQYHGPQFQQMHRPIRNPQEVEEARAARKADIERRCMQLEPPLAPNVLQHIETFQAAMQITTPMNDAQWEMLRPRILAQREAAELIEHQKAEQLAALQATMPSVQPEETFHKPAKEVYDREYEQAQEPLRKRLGEYADDFINGQWHGGQGLDRDSAPTFAIETMLHVRKRYMEDKQVGNLPVNDHAKSESPKQGTPTPDPFLSLDNMKWVYDNKIRTHTDQHRRELFICAGCAEERRPKWFAFEGLIQHYGAKHTTAFSRGNIVVHWQTAEWPAEPPFNTKPAPFIKMDRKASDYKAHGRARNTPQHTSQEGPFVPPGPGVLLSENPLFASAPQHQVPSSNGYHHGPPGLPPYQQHPHGHPGPQAGHPHQAALPAQPAIDMSYDAQLNKLCSDAREIWDELEGVKDMLECVRIQTVVHHVVTRFTETFRQKPNLDLLTDALATNTLMRPLKNAHGLACKLCVAAQTDGSASYQSYYARIANMRLYNASSLITHFKIVHQPHDQGEYLDWAKDMIELPETELISELIRTPGMDDDKLALVAKAFPNAFPHPLPKIGLVAEAPPEVGPDSGLATRLLDRFTKKNKQGEPKKKKGLSGNGTPLTGRDGSQEPPLPEPTEDEYDPRRPMYVANGLQEQTADPARFDTDLARKSSASVTKVSGLPAFNLPPETLAALSSLTGFTAQPPKQEIERAERSPSVGRAEPVSAAPMTGASNAAPASMAPDISAILASLTGHLPPAQTATPVATPGSRAGPASAQRHVSAPAADPYAPMHGSPAVYQQESRRASGRYVPELAYQTAAEPPSVRYEPYDARATVGRNSRRYDQNQQLHAYAEAPQHAPATRVSPPLYRYVYEDDQQPYVQQPVYREAPVQYIQLPPEQHQPSHHHPQYQQYEQHHAPAPAPKPIYLDQYGRPVELIPIDSAPAPVQYAPHPFEQQQQQQYARRAEPVAYAPAAAPHYQPAVYGSVGEGRQVYYEHAAPAPVPVTMAQGGQRYLYEDEARSSVPPRG